MALPLVQLVAPVTGELTSSQPTFIWHTLPEALSYRVVVTTDPGSGEVSGEEYWGKVVASTNGGGVENSVSKVESFKIR